MIMNYVYLKKNEISKVLSQSEVEKSVEKYNYNMLRIACNLCDQSDYIPFELDDIITFDKELIPEIGKVYLENYNNYQKTYYKILGFVKSKNNTTRIDKIGIYVETLILTYRSKFDDFNLIHIYTPLTEFIDKIKDSEFKRYNKLPSKITNKLEKWILNGPENLIDDEKDNNI